ncbi:MAG: two-component sensor histidine kinase [Phycisphaerae bacterium]|nr:two-component sensor histidine kinase [Phycisphaerae bacterium]
MPALYITIGIIIGSGITAIIFWRIGQRYLKRYKQQRNDLVRRVKDAEKMAQLGDLANSLAHEIRNPLSIIKINLQLLSEDIGDFIKATKVENNKDYGGIVDPAQKLARQLRKIKNITGESNRLAQTLNDFMRYAGRIELNPARQDINELLDDLIDFYEPQALNKGVQIRHNLVANKMYAKVDADLIKQALLNLFINAIQAMDGAGELIIRSRIENDNICIEISDTGPGMSEEVKNKIFDPYYTKRKGGTGLGLPTCRRIIEAHNGHIDLISEPGRGTSFTITFPAVE